MITQPESDLPAFIFLHHGPVAALPSLLLETAWSKLATVFLSNRVTYERTR